MELGPAVGRVGSGKGGAAEDRALVEVGEQWSVSGERVVDGIGTEAIEAEGPEQLAGYAAVWGAPGSPFKSMRGMLSAIEHVRERDAVYLGTCADFQYALIEYTRNVLGIADADSAENQPEGKNIVITPVQCAVPSGPRLSGPGVARVVPGTLLEKMCGPIDLRGEFFCSFETNTSFVTRWQAAGLRVAAQGAEGEMRALELPSKGFFVATLFQPQLSSSYQRPHPIVVGFLAAAYRHSVAPTPRWS